MKAKSVIHGKPVGPPFPRRRPARLNRLGALAVGFRFLEDFRNKVNPVSPTITVVDGASMLGGFYAHNASTIIVTGGRTSVLLYDQAMATLSGGTCSMQAGGTNSITI